METTEKRKRKKPKKPNRRTLTDLWLKGDRRKAHQYTVWDSGTNGQSGLGVLISPGGTKTFRSMYYFPWAPGIAHSRKIGRYPEMGLSEAREIVREDRRMARQGIDPKAAALQKAMEARSETYEAVVTEFVQKYARPRQRTWKQTEGHLRKLPWSDRPFNQITKQDAYDVLDDMIAEGYHAKADKTLAWLRVLWKWAWKRDLVPTPLMDAVEIETESKVRDRVYSDDEVKQLWNGSEELTDHEQAFIKLLILLGVRKGELAGMKVSELDDPANPTLWTVPHERTKSKKKATRKRVYVVPLPPLGTRILKPLLMDKTGDDFVFPGRRKGTAMLPRNTIVVRVRNVSGIVDWYPHAHRHTIATWMQNEGTSEFERGLILNHAGAGSVTAGYSHGYPVKLKREWLERWADHVEAIVHPEGVTLLR